MLNSWNDMGAEEKAVAAGALRSPLGSGGSDILGDPLPQQLDFHEDGGDDDFGAPLDDVPSAGPRGVGPAVEGGGGDVADDAVEEAYNKRRQSPFDDAKEHVVALRHAAAAPRKAQPSLAPADVWTPLDPYDASQADEDRPLQKGRSWKQPPKQTGLLPTDQPGTKRDLNGLDVGVRFAAGPTTTVGEADGKENKSVQQLFDSFFANAGPGEVKVLPSAREVTLVGTACEVLLGAETRRRLVTRKARRAQRADVGDAACMDLDAAEDGDRYLADPFGDPDDADVDPGPGDQALEPAVAGGGALDLADDDQDPYAGDVPSPAWEDDVRAA